ncbi:MAG: N-acetyltransferase [Alphaproteobacteria bacterium]|nr:N-acetyltransferase [Alphaproteobacteria bacterium]
MNKKDINFEIKDNGCRLCAICNGKQIGSIFFVKSGSDKIIISDAEIDSHYSATEIELYLIQEIISMARTQHKKVISICPYISEIFTQHPEFDDVRLLNYGR